MAAVKAEAKDSLTTLDTYENQVYELKCRILEVKIEMLEVEVKIARLGKDETNHTLKERMLICWFSV